MAVTTTEVTVEADLDDPNVFWRRTYINKKLVSEEPVYFQDLIHKKNNLEPYLGVVEVTKTQDVQTLHSICPEPTWLYEYEDQLVLCKYCGETFSYTELKSSDDIDISVNQNICPKCGTWECCELLEFERFSIDMTEGICLQQK